MAIKDFFSNDFITDDFAQNEMLLTHYYRNDLKTVKNAVIDVAKKMGYDVEDVNDKFNEILITDLHSEITISLVEISYYEIATDLHIITHYLLSRARGIKHISEFYTELDRQLYILRKGGRK